MIAIAALRIVSILSSTGSCPPTTAIFDSARIPSVMVVLVRGQVTSSNILAFMDDEVTVEPSWLQNLTAALHDHQWAGAGGRIVSKWTCPPPRWLSLESQHAAAPLVSFDLGPEAGQLNEPPFGTNMAFRREMFEKCGGFRTDLGPRPGSEIRNEDTEFGAGLLSAGERLRYEPSAVVYQPVQKNRMEKEYFLRWWFHKGEANIRQFGVRPGTKYYVAGIPIFLFRNLGVWTFKWMVGVHPAQRFSSKLNVWTKIGEILECHRQSSILGKEQKITVIQQSNGIGRLAQELPSCEVLLWMYERMTLIREFEERLKWLVETGVPVGAVHYYTGQEACAVGVCAALEPSDWIASTHRGHGHCIAKGVEVHRMMAELYGKTTGSNRGKGGSMHITDVRVGMLGVNPIVGMGVTHAVGAALSAKVRKTSQVAAAFFGEGAASIGAVHEAMNLAAIWKLPVVFVCENNGYAQSTPVEYALSVPQISDRAAAYNMPGLTVDGQDVIAVWEAAVAAVERARAGQGPSLIECTTYRYSGHHQGDDTHRYRTREEEKAARERDCIRRFREQMLDQGLLHPEELGAIDSRNRKKIDEAVAFAEASPLPQPADLFTDVYVTESEGERE